MHNKSGKMIKSTVFIAQAGIIAAIYTILTLALWSWSYGPIQVRVSEALTVLPAFTPAAIPGLFIGCLISNIFSPQFAYIDMVFGSLATLLAAYLSYKMPRRELVPLPPIIVNGIIIGIMLHYFYKLPSLPLAMLWVALGETVACYVLGYPLILLLEKYRNKIFK